MILKQLFDQDTWTYTYLLADPNTREAILIDPVLEQVERDTKLLSELGLTLLYTLDTHVHADHVTGSGQLRERLGSQSVVSAAAGVDCVDIAAQHGDQIRFGSYNLEVRSTPGHTSGCLSLVLEDGSRTLAFTGDALFIRGCGRTDFQEGDPKTLYQSVQEQIFSLPDHTVIYPGHDYRGHRSSTVGEERAFNPRLNDQIEEAQFVAIMDGLNLGYPKKIDVAVPANLACGSFQEAGSPEPLLATQASPIQELDALAAKDLSSYRIIDVRQPDEFFGELGSIEGAELVPLDTLDAAASSWASDDKLLVVCRSGGRAGQACDYLTQSGFNDVTNLVGGMMAWATRSETASVGGQR